jgi:hypothetical protein
VTSGGPGKDPLLQRAPKWAGILGAAATHAQSRVLLGPMRLRRTRCLDNSRRVEQALGAIACPVAALKAWLEAAVITEGPVFRPIAKGQRISDARLTDRSIANIVKAHAARVGLDAAAFAGHSLRHVGSKSGVLHYWRHAAPYVFALRVRIQNDALYHELEELVRWLRDERMPVYSS